MTKIFRALTIAALLATASTAAAQEKQTHVGLGVSITAFDFVSLISGMSNRASFYLPIDLGRIKVEPEFGWWSASEDGGDVVRHATVGAGLLLLVKPAPTSFYMGGRLALTFNKQKPWQENNITGTDVRAVAVAGAEHYVVPAFSVGAEAQFGVLKIGETHQAGTLISEDVSLWSSSGVIFLRYYYN